MEHEPRKITGYLVDVDKGTAGKATIEKSLESYYSALNCDYVDIVQRTIDGRTFDIICDDEALLKADPKASAFSGHCRPATLRPALYGNLFVVRFDGVDDVCSLTDDDIAFLGQRTAIVDAPHDVPRFRRALIHLSY